MIVLVEKFGYIVDSIFADNGSIKTIISMDEMASIEKTDKLIKSTPIARVIDSTQIFKEHGPKAGTPIVYALDADNNRWVLYHRMNKGHRHDVGYF